MKSYRVSSAVLDRIVALCNQDPVRIGIEVNRLLCMAEQLEMPYSVKMKQAPGGWPAAVTYDPKERTIDVL